MPSPVIKRSAGKIISEGKRKDRERMGREMKRLIVGISGASGVIYAQRFLQQIAQRTKIEVHLVITSYARTIIQHEMGKKVDFSGLAFRIYPPDDLAAPIASGSFSADGMIIIPCSMKTLAGLASGFAENLLLRAADVALKEKRPLFLVPRESPLSAIHLENLLKLARLGVHIIPACPAFYCLPRSLDDLVDQFVFRIMDVLGLKSPLKRWRERSPD